MSDDKGTFSPPLAAESFVLDYQRPAASGGLNGFISTIGWAIYLGMSWTWCIGMFLPVLLIRDYGAWAWVVFAVPNVVGAAAMGWVLRKGQSEKLVEQHAFAVGAFSFVTATFQIFFALWMLGVPGSAWGVLGVACVMSLLIGDGFRFAIALAVITLTVSTASMTFAGGFSLPPNQFLNAPWSIELAGLAPVCAFGFLLCPYLDRTFHRARQALSPKQAMSAFSVGFGVFFLAMIYFTLTYSWWMLRSYGGPRYFYWIGIHWMIQLAFTTALHWQNIATAPAKMLGSAALAVALWYGMRFVNTTAIEAGEFVYRLFMSFYGLVFPTYVWICMTPTWRQPLAPSRRQWLVFVVAVILAAPFYWVAFIEGRMNWVVPGVLIVLAARFALPKRVVSG